MIRALSLALLVMMLATLDVAGLGAAAQEPAPSLRQFSGGEVTELAQQQRRRRTLMDLLFGAPEPAPQPRPQPQPEVERPADRTPAPRRQEASPPRPQLPPPPPAIEKAENATKLAVLGDSLAVDLAKALDRLYAEDPNLQIVDMGVGSSGFVRDDFFDWEQALSDALAADSFDLAIVIMGINDRQALGGADPLTDPWKVAYSERLNAFLAQLRAAGKPVLWVGLPPMEAPSYSAAMNQISSLQRLASVSAGAEFVDIYERFVDDEGKYSAYGPDLNGQRVLMRKSDGIHFSAAGSDKLAFFLGQSLKAYYRGGAFGIEVADPLAGTDAGAMVRLPYQGVGQIRMLEVAGAVISLNGVPNRADDLLTAGVAQPPAAAPFDLDLLVKAPVGRVDAFGVGVAPSESEEPAAAP